MYYTYKGLTSNAVQLSFMFTSSAVSAVTMEDEHPFVIYLWTVDVESMEPDVRTNGVPRHHRPHPGIRLE